MKRREFLGKSLIFIAGLGFSQLFKIGRKEVEGGDFKSKIVVAKGDSPEDITIKAIEGLGGIENFVKKGNKVLIKPNIAWDRTIEQAANTHPDVVKALIKMCKKAGASEIIVVDNSCSPWKVTYYKSGIEAVVKEAGGIINPPLNFRKVTISGTQVLKEAEILEDVLDADVIINVPIVKVHGSDAKVTISMKNLMGIVKDRGYFHRTDLSRCIAEIASYIKPHLIVIDATRVLLTGGPAGPGMVKQLNMVAAGTDFVALDAFGATLLGINPDTVRHIQIAIEMGLGQGDLSKVNVKYL